jgi:hypothetical protein
LYVAVGIEEVLAHITEGGSPTAEERLDWPAATALYGGAALYLVGRAAFLRLTAGPVPAALGLITAVVAGLVGYEKFNAKAPDAALLVRN